jgi:hypothetical protein
MVPHNKILKQLAIEKARKALLSARENCKQDIIIGIYNQF